MPFPMDTNNITIGYSSLSVNKFSNLAFFYTAFILYDLKNIELSYHNNLSA